MTAPAPTVHSASAPGPARWPSPSPNSSRSGCAPPATPSSWSPSAPPATARPPRSPTLGVGVFVSQLRDALVAGEVDLAVHSYKDLPTAPDPRLVHRRGPAAGGPARRAGRPRRPGARRAARGGDGRHRLAAAGRPARGARPGPAHRADPGQRRHPHRARCAAGELDAVVVAAAGLRRLGRVDEASELLDPLQMLPAPAQGALAVECRVGRHGARRPAARRCSTTRARGPPSPPSARCWPRWKPAAAPRWARWPTWCPTSTDDGRVVDRVFLRAVVGTGDGALLRASATGDLDDAEKLGAALAAELLDMAGGSDRSGHDASSPAHPCGGRPPRARSGARRRRRRPRVHRQALRTRSTRSRSMNRAPSTPGRVAFVGSGPGDPGLLTVRARDALAGAPLVVTDPDVPEGVLALVADGAEVRPAVGEPADVAAGPDRRGDRGPAGRAAGRRRPADRRRRGGRDRRRRRRRAAVRRRPRRRRRHRRAGLRRRPARLRARRGGRAGGVSTGRRWPTRPARSCCTPPPAHLADIVVGLTEHGVAASHAGRRHRERHPDRAEDRADHPRDARRARAATSTARWSSRSAPRSSSATGCPGGSRGRCTAGGCWCRAPRTRRA